MRERLQWMKPFIGTVLGLFLLEVVWSNWYGMTIPKNTHQVLARDVWTEDNGSFETAPIILDTYVKNVYIALAEDGAEQVGQHEVHHRARQHRQKPLPHGGIVECVRRVVFLVLAAEFAVAAQRNGAQRIVDVLAPPAKQLRAHAHGKF